MAGVGREQGREGEVAPRMGGRGEGCGRRETTVEMRERERILGMRLPGVRFAFCSRRCGCCRRRHSARAFLILKISEGIGHPLETVLWLWRCMVWRLQTVRSTYYKRTR